MTNDEERLYAGLDLLDRQLLDSEDVPCGKVDDLRLAVAMGEDPNDGPIITEILTTPGALADRLPGLLGSLLRNVWKVLRPDKDPLPVAIPWSAVRKHDYAIHLTLHREEIGVLRSEDWARRNIINKIPGAR